MSDRSMDGGREPQRAGILGGKSSRESSSAITKEIPGFMGVLDCPEGKGGRFLSLSHSQGLRFLIRWLVLVISVRQRRGQSLIRCWIIAGEFLIRGFELNQNETN